MRKIIIALFSLCFLNSFAQTSNFFDDLYGVAVSDLYDYKNPVFDSRLNDLSTSVWFSCERFRSNGASDIVVKKCIFSGFEPDIALTSAVNDSNINPSIYDKLIVWESNKDGNHDIYFSLFNGTSWSAASSVPGSSTLDDETQPCIYNNNVSPASSNYYLLTFKRGPDIILKKYSTSLNTWDPVEYNLTDSIIETCSHPVILGSNPNYAVAYIKQVSDTSNIISVKHFTLQSSSGNLAIQGAFSLEHNALPEKMKLSKGYGYGPGLTFSAIPASGAGSEEIYILTSIASPVTELISSVPTGSSISGKGVNMGIIFNGENSGNSPDVSGLSSTAFGCITRSFVNNDSATISLCRHFNSNGFSNEFRHRGVGNMNTTTKLDLSPPIGSGNYFKVHAVWEQQFAGKTALFETVMTDVLGGVSYLGTAVKYSLQQNYPNPFNPTTKIKYEIPGSAFVELKVFNSLGKEVSTLVNQSQTSGTYSVELNASDLPSGIYFYTLRAGEFVQTRKMILLK